MKNQNIYYKCNLNLDTYYLININEDSSNMNEYFVYDRFVAGQRMLRASGNQSDLKWLIEQLALNGFQNSFTDKVQYSNDFGLIKEIVGNWYTQKYLDAFEQTVTIGVPYRNKTDHKIKWLKFLEDEQNCLKSVIIKKVKEEYNNCLEGVQGIWEKEEIRDSFPTLNSERDVLNLITDTWIDIYDKEAFEIHMPNHIFSIRANCPWDIEHGIEIEIKLEDIEAVTNK